jgi:hypothetical protein
MICEMKSSELGQNTVRNGRVEIPRGLIRYCYCHPLLLGSSLADAAVAKVVRGVVVWQAL